jgi:deoxyadenosine/deoxycytidine kinase
MKEVEISPTRRIIKTFINRKNEFSSPMLITALLEKFNHLRRFYTTDREMTDHLLSGEVTISIKDMFEMLEAHEQKVIEYQEALSNTIITQLELEN